MDERVAQLERELAKRDMEIKWLKSENATLKCEKRITEQKYKNAITDAKKVANKPVPHKGQNER